MQPLIALFEVLKGKVHLLGLFWVEVGQVGDCVDNIKTEVLVGRLAVLGNDKVDLARVLFVLEKVELLSHRMSQDAVADIVDDSVLRPSLGRHDQLGKAFFR